MIAWAFCAEALQQTEAKEAMIPAVLVSPMMMLGKGRVGHPSIESLIPGCRAIQQHVPGILTCDGSRYSRM